ncbi:MAG: VOC family protein [Trueperaceae bacterium]|nr:VOC family protein [Trueperaceae bacterium]
MIQAIHHVAVRVTDLERSIAFYADLLGLAVRTRTALASGARIAFLAHPGGGCELELIAGLHDHHAGDGLVHHVAFLVTDVDEAFARLRDAGVTLLDAAPEALASGRRLFSFRGPDGERLQVTSA